MLPCNANAICALPLLPALQVERGVDLNRIESACYFAIVDASDESTVRRGERVGSMYGLVSKPRDAASDSISFTDALAATDWSNADMAVPSGLPQSSAAKITAMRQQRASQAAAMAAEPQQQDMPPPEGSDNAQYWQGLATAAAVSAVTSIIVAAATAAAAAHIQRVRSEHMPALSSTNVPGTQYSTIP